MSQQYDTLSNFERKTFTLNYDSKDPVHLEKWRTYISTEACKTFGSLSKIFEQDSYPDGSTYLKEYAHLETKATLTKFEEAIVNQQVALMLKEKAEHAMNKPKLFGTILDSISKSSKIVLQRAICQQPSIKTSNNLTDAFNQEDEYQFETDYDKQEDQEEQQDNFPTAPKKLQLLQKPADDERSLASSTEYDSRNAWKAFMSRQDPLELWLLIKQTHQNARNNILRLDVIDTTLTFFRLKQWENELLADYKLRFDTAYENSRNLKLPLFNQEQCVTFFLMSLNSLYDDLKSQLKLDSAKGINCWPSNLSNAFLLASHFETKHTVTYKDTDGTEKEIALVGIADDITKAKAQHLKKIKKENKHEEDKYSKSEQNPNTTGLTDSTQKTRGTTRPCKTPCLLCLQIHYVSDCPFLPMAQEIAGDESNGEPLQYEE
jgi:hypothetical protein